MPQIKRYSVKTLFLVGLFCAVFSIAAVTVSAFTSVFWITSTADTLATQSMQHASTMVDSSKTMAQSISGDRSAKFAEMDSVHNEVQRQIEKDKLSLQTGKFQIFLVLSAVALVSFIVLAVGIGLLSKVIFPSISQFLDAFEEYSAGELSYRVVDEHMPQELSRVANGFNSMANKLQQSYAKLAYQSMNDELTGVYNRRRFIMDLEREVKRARRYKRTLSLMLIDMDNFSAINDNHGHEAGDKVLCKTVDFIYRCIRDSDSLYRYGSEEFAVILVEIPDKDTGIVAERIRAHISDAQFALPDGTSIQTSASIGISNFPNNSDNEISLIHGADEALYRAKEQGKNRVVHTNEFSHAKVS